MPRGCAWPLLVFVPLAEQRGGPDSKSQRRRAVRSFVLRTGRMTDSQSKALEQHWPLYGLEQNAGLLDLSATFPRPAPLTVEIGFGMGDSLLTMADQDRQRNFIGIEVHTPGVGRLLAGVHRLGLDNLRVYRSDAIDVLKNCFQPDSIDCVQIFFPDPWPKKRHHKRRLIQPAFLELIEPLLKHQASLHIATDWQAYAEHCLELLSTRPGWANSSPTDTWVPRPQARPLTKFEQRGQKLGHGVWDILFVRNKNP